METDEHIYDVAIIGGGVSGTSLLYTLAKYTDISKVILLEKCDRPGQVNSKACNNSQTLHVGDIETNYSIEKVRQVRPASMMIVSYANKLPSFQKDEIVFSVSKMILAVGQKEVAMLEKRYTSLLSEFPELKKLDREEIAAIEPALLDGRDKQVPLLALYAKEGHAIDFEKLAASFVEVAVAAAPNYTAQYKTVVSLITRNDAGHYVISMKGGGKITAATVVVDADSYSLFFAKQLGYGKNFSLIPIGGSFYFSKKILHGKVYTMQEPLLPFAAVHGDPDVLVPDVTRWGPTARFAPMLESRNGKTRTHYFRASGLGKFQTWKSFISILKEPVRSKFLFKNMLYELPFFGKRMFLANVQKIVPSMRAGDLKKAKGYGGMRLQRVNIKTGELELGEGKIIGENIIFNMTPSPGASVCLYNALRDAKEVVSFLHGKTFNEEAMKADLM